MQVSAAKHVAAAHGLGGGDPDEEQQEQAEAVAAAAMAVLEAQLAMHEDKQANSKKQQPQQLQGGRAAVSTADAADTAAEVGEAAAAGDAAGATNRKQQNSSRKAKATKLLAGAAGSEQQAPAAGNACETAVQQQQQPRQQLVLHLGDPEPQQQQQHAPGVVDAAGASDVDDDASIALQGNSWAEVIRNYNALLDDSDSPDSDSDPEHSSWNCTSSNLQASTGQQASQANGVAQQWSGLRPKDVLKAAVLAACAELVLRIEEEQHRQQQARLFGVANEQRMSGITQQRDSTGCYTDTAGCICHHCKADLWLSAVVASAALGLAVCPEHAAALGAAPSSCTLLFRRSIEELQWLVFEVAALFPSCDEDIRSAQQRVRQRPWMRVKSLGPLMKLQQDYQVPRAPEVKAGGRDPATPVAGVCGLCCVGKGWAHICKVTCLLWLSSTAVICFFTVKGVQCASYQC